MTFDLISTWGEKCGIYEYARALLDTSELGEGTASIFARKLPDTAQIEVDAHPFLASGCVHRCWTSHERDPSDQDVLYESLQQSKSKTLWVQYHPSFFTPAFLRNLAQILPKTGYQARILSVHNPEGLGLENPESSAFLEAFTDIVVHNEDARAAIGQNGQTASHVIPHFIYARAGFERQKTNESFTIATMGFAAQNKRVPLLIEAFSIAHALQPEMRLNILTSPLPTHAAHFEISKIVAAIKHSPAQGAITAHLEPKAMPHLLSELSCAHLLVMPYADTGESASGAARMGLSAGVPILRSKSGIFADLPGGDFVLEDDEPKTIAEALLMLSQMPTLISQKRAQIDQIYKLHSAHKTAERFAEMLL